MPPDQLLLQTLKKIEEEISAVRGITTDILVSVGLLKYRLDEKDADCEKHSKSIENLEAAESKRQIKSATILGMRTDFVYWLGIIVSLIAMAANWTKIMEWIK